MHILIGKALQHLYMLKESVLLWKHIHVSFTFKKNTVSIFLLYTRYRNTYQQGSKLLQT